MSEAAKYPFSKAARFEALHIHLPTDYETYQQEMLLQWKEDAEDALEAGRSIRPLWLRRTDDMSSEFGAHIDYIMPMANEVRYLAALDIGSNGGGMDVDVWLPKDDGSGEPVTVMSEPYNLENLEYAIEFVESSVQPSTR